MHTYFLLVYYSEYFNFPQYNLGQFGDGEKNVQLIFSPSLKCTKIGLLPALLLYLLYDLKYICNFLILQLLLYILLIEYIF